MWLQQKSLEIIKISRLSFGGGHGTRISKDGTNVEISRRKSAVHVCTWLCTQYGFVCLQNRSYIFTLDFAIENNRIFQTLYSLQIMDCYAYMAWKYLCLDIPFKEIFSVNEPSWRLAQAIHIWINEIFELDLIPPFREYCVDIKRSFPISFLLFTWQNLSRVFFPPVLAD